MGPKFDGGAGGHPDFDIALFDERPEPHPKFDVLTPPGACRLARSSHGSVVDSVVCRMSALNRSGDDLCPPVLPVSCLYLCIHV